MLDQLTNLCLSITDPALGWLLKLPRDLVIVILAFTTALLLTVVRVFTTNQNMLKRCKQDKDILNKFLRAAKKKGDKDDVLRFQTTIGQIGMKTMAAEWKPLVVSLIPIALLATWAFSRVGYLPPKPGETVKIEAYFSSTAIGKTVHIVGQDGVRAQDNQWVQPVEKGLDPDGSEHGMAKWSLSFEQRPEPYVLSLRYAGKTYKKEVIVDGLRYADLEPIILAYGDQDDVKVVKVAVTPYKPLGVVPGIPAYNIYFGGTFPCVSFYNAESIQPKDEASIPGPPWMPFDPWIVGYLIVVFPLAFILKPMLHIY
jgi:uncharacterized membrane protein (DUF106 family)